MSIKNAVLAALIESGKNSASGEELAARLGVSRNAVWKAVNQLKSEGYKIEAVRNKGYSLISDGNIISKPLIKSFLCDNTPVCDVIVYDSADSTNSLAKTAAQGGAPHGTVICAEHQTTGRGRMGRSFFSPPGSGLYMSVIIRQDASADEAAMITSAAAVAVCRAIEELCGVSAQIKWVNDIYINGKKVCGILTEAGLNCESGTLDYAVIGIGVNVGKAEFPDELKSIATSLEEECGQKISRSALCGAILNQLFCILPQIKDGGFLEESRRRSVVIGKNITVHSADRCFPARALDINNKGQLIIDDGDRVYVINSGEISIRLGNRNDSK